MPKIFPGHCQQITNQHMNLTMGHRCSIIHRSNPKACVDVKNGQKGDQSGVKIISMSCTCFDVQSWFLVLITYNHKTNHQGGFDLFRTTVSHHKVHICGFFLLLYVPLHLVLATR